MINSAPVVYVTVPLIVGVKQKLSDYTFLMRNKKKFTGVAIQNHHFLWTGILPNKNSKQNSMM